MKNKRKKHLYRICGCLFGLAVLGAIVSCFGLRFIEEYLLPTFYRPVLHEKIQVEDVHSLLSFHELPDSTLPRIDIVLPEEYTLSKKRFTECSVEISNAGDYCLAETEAKIRIRGNSTAQADKKPFKLRFKTETSLFGGGYEKEWVLLANATDLTNIHNYVSLRLYDYISGEDSFVPMCVFVDVYVNNEYQGVYNLCDQVGPGQTRVPIDEAVGETPEETDYLVVEDLRAFYADIHAEEGYEWFWMDKLFVSFEVKSPDTDDPAYTREYTKYIKDYLDEVYAAIRRRDFETLEQYIDIDSFIDGQLIAMITKDSDMARGSKYFYLPAGGKLTYGPVWDMDMTFGYATPSYFGRSSDDETEEHQLYNQLFKRMMKIPEFEERYKARFFELYDGGLEDFILGTIDEISAEYHKEFVNEFECRKNWGRFGNEEANAADDYDAQIEYMKKWTRERLAFLYREYSN